MENRFVLTIALCLALSLGYFAVLQKLQPPPPVQPATTSTEQTRPDTPGHKDTASLDLPVEPATDTTKPTVEPEAPPPPEFENYQDVLENDVIRIDFEARGAVATAAMLKNYMAEDHQNQLMLFSPELQAGTAFRLELDKVPPRLDPVSRVWERVSSSESTLSYRCVMEGGKAITKTFTLGDSYLLNVDIEFTGPWPVTHAALYRFTGPDRIRVEKDTRAPFNYQVIAHSDAQGGLAEVEWRKVAVIKAPGAINTLAITKTVLWSGLTSNYFAYAIRPDYSEGANPAAKVWVQGEAGAVDKERSAHYLKAGIQDLIFRVGFETDAEADRTHRYEVFLGPKDRAILAQYETQGYGELIDYGFFGLLVRLFLWLLDGLHWACNSYGVSVIILTVIVKICLHPINKKNQGGMMRQQKKMSKIQPQMKEIKERYKNDSLKANREIQKLMKENNVNPAQMFGGCLLMFLQLPIWIGLIKTFGVALELRHTPFLYITDLTQPDRLFMIPSIPLVESFNLLPVLYVIMTLISQKMMPKASDPQMAQQQKMMTFMMIAFGVIFYKFQAALLLYFLTSAALGIIEQKIIRAELRREGLV